jgi:hypothetical protein
MATSLELAITAIRSGRKEEGRQLLNLLIQQNPNNEMAWLWMSSVVNTDEQRARCLYHVLAINPDNSLARRGLQILGIVVSDSRPVKVPRDSQPIPVQRPQDEVTTPWPVPAASSFQPLETQPLPTQQPEPSAANQTAPMEERRPFRLDPKTITQELPFIPIREPFAEPARRSPSAFVARADQPAAAEGAQEPSESPPPAELAPAVTPNSDKALIPLPLPDFPDPLPPNPSNPATDTNLPPPQPQPDSMTAAESAPTFGSGITPNETRPSQPIWVTHSNVTMGMPTPGPQNQPPYSAPGINSNVTMGMPTPYFQPQNPLQAMPAIHSNATMGMPFPPQNGPTPQPSDPLPMMQPNGMMGMAYAPAPFPVPYPQNQVYHSSSTMAMPTMTEAEARARFLASQAPVLPGYPDPLRCFADGLFSA